MAAFGGHETGVPGRGLLGNAQGVAGVLRMVRGRRVYVQVQDPADGLAGHDVQADWLEPGLDAGRIVTHVDLDEVGGAGGARQGETC